MPSRRLCAVIMAAVIAVAVGLCPHSADASRNSRTAGRRSKSVASKRVRRPLAPKIARKYNTDQILKYHFAGPAALDALKKRYRTARVPSFLNSFLHLKPGKDRSAVKRDPRVMGWSKRGDLVILPNPGYLSVDELDRPHALKDRPEGFALVAWDVHPNLLRDSPFADPTVRNNPAEAARRIAVAERTDDQPAPDALTFAEIETPDQPYLASMLDLDRSHVPHLRRTRKLIYQHLRAVYGVDPAVDTVRIYYHFPYASKTATLHLHVRINQATHYVERSKSFSLDSVVRTLEAGRSVNDLILARQREFGGGIYANRGAEGDVAGTAGVTVETIPNLLKTR